MGVDIYPKLMYGFLADDARIHDEAVLFDCARPELRSGGDHVVGFEVALKDPLKDPEHDQHHEFGKIMKEELNIDCTYHLCIKGDLDLGMYGCDDPPISVLELFKRMKSGLSDEKILEILNRIYRAISTNGGDLTMKDLKDEQRKVRAYNSGEGYEENSDEDEDEYSD